MAVFDSTLKPKLIYVFAISDDKHSGCLKIGEATMSDTSSLSPAPNSRELNQAAKARIDQYTKTAGIDYQLLYTECTLYIDSAEKVVKSFNDKQVHQVLERSGVQKATFANNQGTEWFRTDLETVKKAIAAVKQGKLSLNVSEITQGRNPIIFRPEQREAIDKTLKKFKHGNRMLWNAKMRFGKTLSALQVVKELQLRRTLILTHRPAVNVGWFEDFSKIFYDEPEYDYGSKTNGNDLMNMEFAAGMGTLKYVYFASMQDLRGSEIVGGKFDKNDQVFSTPWDLIIVDEAHEGTQTQLGQNVMAELTNNRTTKVLKLSGTPFNLLDEFTEDEVFTWDYTMEQTAKAQWDSTYFGDPNPYAGLPTMNIYTYDLGSLLSRYSDADVAFNFTEFLRVKDDGTFVHEKDVKNFLDLLTKEDKDSCYPFANQEYRDNFKHTLWMVPGVKAAKALSAMLKVHSIFGNFEIVNVAGEGDEEVDTRDALKAVKDAIKENEYTITISCGRLTTGISVPEWTAVLMISGSFSTAASSYMQTIFRVQTPATIDGKTKEQCYVFDFAPDRTLKVIAETAKVSAKAGKTTDGDRETLGKFLNFCPIISIDGSQMKDKITADKLFTQLKKVYVERVVRSGFEDNSLYSDELLKMDSLDLEDFNELKKKIGTTKAMPKTGDVDVNEQGLTKEEYEQKEKLEKKKRKEGLTDAEKKKLEELNKAKKNRATAISILRGISIRMPLLIYGAELKDESKDITIENFASLIDDQSWEEFMPNGVDKLVFSRFRKYYDRDIFIEAGRRIRSLALAADKMTVEQRIERITGLFANFRNPDKETVLTPWRVVNLHLGSCLGGYSFYNEDYSETIEEPHYIKNGNITDDVFNPQSHILEINSKTGLYPLYVAYSIYRAKLKDSLFSVETVEDQQAIWDDVLRDNIFVICKTRMAQSITKRTLRGFRNVKTNTHAFDDLINQITNKQSELIDKIEKGMLFKNFKNMKFNAVVGNPPYQFTIAQKDTDNGQKRVMSIFHHFQTISDDLGNYTCLIYPAARWIHRAGKGLAEFGLKQINDPHLKMIYLFPNANEIFKDAGISDGISIVLKDTKKDSGGFKYIYSIDGSRQELFMDNPGDVLMPLNPSDTTIVGNIHRIVKDKSLKFLHESVLSQKLFGIESNFVENNPLLVKEYNDGDSFDPKNEVKLFTNDKAGKSGRSRWYIVDRNIIPTGTDYIDCWKVVVSSANAGGQKRSNQIAVMDNHSAFGRSRVALKTFKTEKEAWNFLKYAKSELIRFAFLMTDESLTSLAKAVPDILDYSDTNTMIDFGGDINAQLYKLFDIDVNAQNHIKEVLSHKAVAG